MSLTDDDAKEIIKALALRRDNAPVILGGFIVVVLTFFLVILAIQSVFEPKNPIYADVMSSLIFIVALVLCIVVLKFYKKDVAMKDKINEVSKQHNLKEFYAGIFPEEQKISTVRVRKEDVLLRVRQIFGVGVLLRVRQIFGVVLILVGGYIILRGYFLLSNSYLSQSSMAGLNIIIVPLETTALYIVGLLLVIFGLFMVFGKDKVLNWAQKIKIA